MEPIRYRRVVVEILGSSAAGAGGGSADDDNALALTREQELAISAAVDAFDKATAAIWAARAEAVEAIKASRGRRGSELDNMRAFLQARSYACCQALCATLNRARVRSSRTCVYLDDAVRHGLALH